jgi:hypothetical protein
LRCWQVKAIWSKLVFTGKANAPKELPTSGDVVKAVAADPNAIGCVEKSAADPSVKIVYTVTVMRWPCAVVEFGRWT